MSEGTYRAPFETLACRNDQTPAGTDGQARPRVARVFISSYMNIVDGFNLLCVRRGYFDKLSDEARGGARQMLKRRSRRAYYIKAKFGAMICPNSVQKNEDMKARIS